MSSTKPRRALRTLIVILLVLAGLGVAADRIGESLAEDRLATAAADEAAQYDVRAASTSVEIGGFGFLPQVARSKFDKVTLSMREPTVEKIAAEDLTVEMHTIHVPREMLTGNTSGTVTVDQADVRLRVSPAALTRLTARTSGIEGLKLQVVNGQLVANLTVQSLKASAVVQPVARNGRIGLVVDEVALDNVPAPLRDSVRTILARGISVPRLPFKAKLRQIAVEGQSIVLTATATNLELAGA